MASAYFFKTKFYFPPVWYVGMNLIQGASTGTGTEEDEDDDYNITEDQRQAMLALQGFGKISNPFNGIRLPQDLQVHGHDDEDDDDDEEYEVEPLPYDIEERLREVNAAFQADQTPLESERPRRVGFRSNLVTVFNSSTESLSASTEEGSEEVPELQPVEDTNAAWILKEPEKEVEGLPKPLKPTEDLLEPLKPILPKPPLTDQQWLRQHLTRKGILNMDNDYDGLNGLIKPQTPGNLSNNTDQCIVSPVPSDGEVGSSDSSSTIPTDSGGASSSSNSDRVLETDASGCERALVERDGKFQWVEVENLTLTERRKVGLDTGRPPSARPKLKDIGKTPSKESPSRDIQIPVPNRAEKAKPGRRPQSPTKLTRRKSKSPPLVSPPPAKTPPKTTTKTSTSTTTRSGPSLRPRTAGPPLEQPLLRHHKSQSLINLDRPRPSTAGNVKQPMAWQWAKLPKYEGMNSPYGLTAEQLKEKESFRELPVSDAGDVVLSKTDLPA
ncbi:unnamed protein product [Darwinula stevensoni]|uniref:Coiled-coil domain-containing protein 181 n=1 Tax=Darwinula stevensoni TaxID=69355 RepID=A0A7R8X9Z4_9CRUS|nr:unnamed protein product [Darwinula stevensoni]CAG0884862.1 unnamed protein product [Darwinula stevensoni]